MDSKIVDIKSSKIDFKKVISYFENKANNHSRGKFAKTFLITYNELCNKLSKDIVNYIMLSDLVWNFRSNIIDELVTDNIIDFKDEKNSLDERIIIYTENFIDEKARKFRISFDFYQTIINNIENLNSDRNDQLKFMINNQLQTNLFNTNVLNVNIREFKKLVNDYNLYRKLITYSKNNTLDCHVILLAYAIMRSISSNDNINHLLNFIKISSYRNRKNQFNRLCDLLKYELDDITCEIKNSMSQDEYENLKFDIEDDNLFESDDDIDE